MFPSGYVWYSLGGIGLSQGIVYSWNGKSGVVTVTTSDLPEGTNKYYTAAQARSDLIAQTITNGVTDHAPSEDVVFDALALKQATGNYITALTGDVTASGPGSVAATVAFVGASSAANVHSAELLANAATNISGASTIVRRDASGNFQVGIIKDSSDDSAFSTALRQIFDSSSVLSFGGNTRILYDSSGVAILGWGSAINFPQLSVSTVPYLDASKNLVSSSVTPTQLSYLDATSSIQTQLNGKQSSLTFGSISTSTTGVSIGSGANSTVGPNVTVNVQTASGSQPGLLSSTDWTTFNNKLDPSSFGNLTESSSSVLTITGGTSAVYGAGTSIQVKQSSGSQAGFLSSTDWTTFNNKQAALTIGNFTEVTSSVLTITGGTGAIIGSGLSVQVKLAGAAQSGYLSSTDWNTFNNKQSSLTFGSISSPNSAITITNGNNATVGPNTTIDIPNASGSQVGLLTNTDWTTFNNKQAAGNYITALTGDGSASGPGSVALTLATVNSNVGSFGSASSVATLTANAKGLITAAGSTSIQIAESQVTNLVSDLAAKQSTTLTSAHILVGNGSNVATDTAMSGDITINNSGVTAIGTNKVTNSQLAQAATLTLKGNNTGGTANVSDLTVSQVNTMLGTLSNPMTTGGDIIYGGASGIPARLANGSSGQYLKSNGGTSAPSYTSFSAPTIQRFTSGSGTYTTPAGVLYLKVTMTGAGGSGGSSGTAGQNNGTVGDNTTFGGSTAGGGAAGQANGNGALGGTNTIGSGHTAIIDAPGGCGGAYQQNNTGVYLSGGNGGGSFITPCGSTGAPGGFGSSNAPANTGCGGAGGGTGATVNTACGTGGGGGGTLVLLITSPSATYSYAIGAGKTGGGAGTNGYAGGNSGSGVLTVEEYYQ